MELALGYDLEVELMGIGGTNQKSSQSFWFLTAVWMMMLCMRMRNPGIKNVSGMLSFNFLSNSSEEIGIYSSLEFQEEIISRKLDLEISGL